MGLHLREFGHYFGGTPVRDIGLLATEGRVSIPMTDGSTGGVLDVCGAFFEFVDEGSSCDRRDDPLDNSNVRRCHDLSPGKTCRVLLTNAAGLYRYDLGDYVRVLDYRGEAPVIEFLHRGAHTSSLTGEKLTEWQATKAFEVARETEAGSACFVLAPAWDEPPFYRLYVETAGQSSMELARRFDAALCQLNVEYAAKRGSGRLGRVVGMDLPARTFDRLNDARRRCRGTSNEQFKHRYLLSAPREDEELFSLTVTEHVSQSAEDARRHAAQRRG
jgi:hypothetical protein